MAKTKVIIEVRGGVVQAVRSTEEIEYVVIDYDDQAEEEVVFSKNEPDNVVSVLSDLYEGSEKSYLQEIGF